MKPTAPNPPVPPALSAIEKIAPPGVMARFQKAIKRWESKPPHDEWAIAEAFAIIQALHAAIGPGAKGMDKWAQVQAQLLESQSRHSARWQELNHAAKQAEAISVLNDDLKSLLEIIERTATREVYRTILEQWRQKRFTEHTTEAARETPGD